MKQIIECVPNISEGRDENVIKQITDVVETVDGVKLLDVDPGKATNRTVITFVGEPNQVIKAAFLLIKKASELIDMSKHSGEHPRMGATDVCPLVPIANISMEETVEYAHKLGEKVGKELQLPGYFYEFAAKEDSRKNLATNRAGEYEGLKNKISSNYKPDFGPTEFTEKAKSFGAINIGARNFLVAYNINLNTTSTRRANAIAFDNRELGRFKREGNHINGKKLKDDKGNFVREPGKLKSVKGIGWFIPEYGVAQISYNLTDITITSIHKAFEETVISANERGIRVTGSELIGLVPLNSLIDAGKYFLKKQNRSVGISDSEIIKIAVKSLGLDELAAFNPQEKIIEYKMAQGGEKQLIDMTLTEFAYETASESPAPGGGSISAYVGALGVSLGTMVANLSSHKAGWDEKWELYSDWAEKGQAYNDKLLKLVDEDTNAFNKIMDAIRLPKSSEEEINSRKLAIDNATKYAIETPFEVMKTSFESMAVMKAMVEIGNPNSVTDAGVGALCARTAVIGAFMNVKINCAGFNDKAYVDKMIAKAQDIEDKTIALESEIIKITNEKIGL